LYSKRSVSRRSSYWSGEIPSFLLEALAGRFLLALALDGMGGDGAVPVGSPEAFVRRSLGEQDVPLPVEDERGERPVSNPVAGVGVESVD